MQPYIPPSPHILLNISYISDVSNKAIDRNEFCILYHVPFFLYYELFLRICVLSFCKVVNVVD